jgi:hypothetical protein
MLPVLTLILNPVPCTLHPQAWKQLVDVGAFMAYLAITMAVALYITHTYW